MNKYETNYITKTCRKNNNRDTWIIKKNTHKPIISKEKYDKVQIIKIEKKSMTKVKHEYLLQGLLYCGECKRKLQYKVFKSKDKKKFLYESARFNCNLFYKKGCKSSICIREKYLNAIVKMEVIKRLDIIKVDEITEKVIDYYKANDGEEKKIREYKNEIEKLERKKRVLYKKKCEQYITIEKFKAEYIRAKEEIKKFEKLMKEIEQNNGNKLEEERIKEVVNEFKNGKCINNHFLKEIINRIEVYSTNRIQITFNL